MGPPKRRRHLVGRLRPQITIDGPKRKDLPKRGAALRGTELQGNLFDRGLHVKTERDAALIAPAFIATRAEIDHVTDTWWDPLRQNRSRKARHAVSKSGFDLKAALGVDPNRLLKTRNSRRLNVRSTAIHRSTFQP
jgi:hypothetical protein